MQEKLEEIMCECGVNDWVQVMSFGHVPAVISENGQAGFAPIRSTFVCLKCSKNIEETDKFKELNKEPSNIIAK